MESLRPEVGADCDIFGYGFQPIADKWDALAAYHYHLVLENSCVPDYWTEKLRMPFLAWCVPLVWGCPNLADYFPADSFVALGSERCRRSLAQVRQTISQPPSQNNCQPSPKPAGTSSKNTIYFQKFSDARGCIRWRAPKIRLKDERLFCRQSLGALVRALTDRWRKPA